MAEGRGASRMAETEASGAATPHIEDWTQAPWRKLERHVFRLQKRICLKNLAYIDPESIDDYIARGGYEALRRVLFAAPSDSSSRGMTAYWRTFSTASSAQGPLPSPFKLPWLGRPVRLMRLHVVGWTGSL